jgi:hypothetical protein
VPESRKLPDEVKEGQIASRYVALDSWVYDAFDKLEGMGLLDSAFAGQRPWTRGECRRLVDEGLDLIESRGGSPFAASLLAALGREFAIGETGDQVLKNKIALESGYLRLMGIKGATLTDAFHFGQTVVNDFGRENREGPNLVTGGSAFIQLSRLIIHGRAEFEAAPTGRRLADSAVVAFQRFDGVPTVTRDFPAVRRARILDLYASFPLGGFQVSLGKQSLWWGQGKTGALNLSNHAEPVMMLRIDRPSATLLPGFLRLLGPYRAQFFVGQLAGHSYIENLGVLHGPKLRIMPLVHGQKLGFKPSPNFEFAISSTTIFAGDGTPLNLRTFLKSFSASNTNPGEPGDPGDRRAGFEFRYRIPGLRKWVTLYSDAMTEDEFSPLAYPRRSAFAPGLYVSRLPTLERWDLRLESAYTALPNLTKTGTYYYNARYRDGFTNKGNLLGHWVGRQGTAYAATSTYWVTAETQMSLFFRKLTVDRDFLSGGGNTTAVGFKGRWQSSKGHEFKWISQFERWNIPVVDPRARRNLTTSLQFSFRLQEKR